MHELRHVRDVSSSVASPCSTATSCGTGRTVAGRTSSSNERKRASEGTWARRLEEQAARVISSVGRPIRRPRQRRPIVRPRFDFGFDDFQALPSSEQRDAFRLASGGLTVTAAGHNCSAERTTVCFFACELDHQFQHVLPGGADDSWSSLLRFLLCSVSSKIHEQYRSI